MSQFRSHALNASCYQDYFRSWLMSNWPGLDRRLSFTSNDRLRWVLNRLRAYLIRRSWSWPHLLLIPVRNNRFPSLEITIGRKMIRANDSRRRKKQVHVFLLCPSEGVPQDPTGRLSTYCLNMERLASCFITMDEPLRTTLFAALHASKASKEKLQQEMWASTEAMEDSLRALYGTRTRYVEAVIVMCTTGHVLNEVCCFVVSINQSIHEMSHFLCDDLVACLQAGPGVLHL